MDKPNLIVTEETKMMAATTEMAMKHKDDEAKQ